MPIYEYRCRQCKRRTTRLVLSLSNPPQLSCDYCHSPALERIMSRFASPKSEEARLEALADPGNLAGLDESDPQSMARFMKKWGKKWEKTWATTLKGHWKGKSSLHQQWTVVTSIDKQCHEYSLDRIALVSYHRSENG